MKYQHVKSDGKTIELDTNEYGDPYDSYGSCDACLRMAGLMRVLDPYGTGGTMMLVCDQCRGQGDEQQRYEYETAGKAKN
jgi:hypothetical protein